MKKKKSQRKIEKKIKEEIIQGILEENKDKIWRRNFFIIIAILEFILSSFALNLYFENWNISFLLSLHVFPIFWLCLFLKKKYENYFHIVGHVWSNEEGRFVDMVEIGIFNTLEDIEYRKKKFNKGHVYQIFYEITRFILIALCLIGIYSIYLLILRRFV